MLTIAQLPTAPRAADRDEPPTGHRAVVHRPAADGTLSNGFEEIDLSDLVTVSEAARAVGRPRPTIYAWVSQGICPCYLVNGRTRVRVADVREAIAVRTPAAGDRNVVGVIDEGAF